MKPAAAQKEHFTSGAGRTEQYRQGRGKACEECRL